MSRLVAASEEIRFESQNRQQVYGWVEQVLVHQQYCGQSKAARGLLRRYVEKMTGLSRAQVTRLIAHYTASGQVRPAQQPLSLLLGDFASRIRSNGGGPSNQACTFGPRALLSVNLDKKIEFQQSGVGVNGRCAILRMPFERYGEPPL